MWINLEIFCFFVLAGKVIDMVEFEVCVTHKIKGSKHLAAVDSYGIAVNLEHFEFVRYFA